MTNGPTCAHGVAIIWDCAECARSAMDVVKTRARDVGAPDPERVIGEDGPWAPPQPRVAWLAYDAAVALADYIEAKVNIGENPELTKLLIDYIGAKHASQPGKPQWTPSGARARAASTRSMLGAPEHDDTVDWEINADLVVRRQITTRVRQGRLATSPLCEVRVGPYGSHRNAAPLSRAEAAALRDRLNDLLQED